jgi:hypothetical protein
MYVYIILYMNNIDHGYRHDIRCYKTKEEAYNVLTRELNHIKITGDEISRYYDKNGFIKSADNDMGGYWIIEELEVLEGQ